MMNKFCYSKNKNLFLNAYVLASVVVILFKIIFAFIDGDIILDTFLIYLRSMIYGSYSYVQHYLTVEFRAVGPLAIFLILHFGILFRNGIINFFYNGKYIIILYIIFPIIGILFFVILRFLLNVNAPFSLIESITFALVTYPLALFKNAKVNYKISDFLIGIFTLLVFIFGIIYMFLE